MNVNKVHARALVTYQGTRPRVRTNTLRRCSTLRRWPSSSRAALHWCPRWTKRQPRRHQGVAQLHARATDPCTQWKSIDCALDVSRKFTSSAFSWSASIAKNAQPWVWAGCRSQRLREHRPRQHRAVAAVVADDCIPRTNAGSLPPSCARAASNDLLQLGPVSQFLVDQPEPPVAPAHGTTTRGGWPGEDVVAEATLPQVSCVRIDMLGRPRCNWTELVK